jgi:dTMP kinase
VDAAKIETLAHWVHPAISPDRTFLFDLPPEVARGRIDGARSLDRFELEKADFHTRVRERYLEFARAEPGRFLVINATQRQDEIDKILEEEVASICFK